MGYVGIIHGRIVSLQSDSAMLSFLGGADGVGGNHISQHLAGVSRADMGYKDHSTV